VRDETLDTLPTESNSCGLDSPRQLIESIIQLLRTAEAPSAEIDRQLEGLAQSLERCFAATKADDTYLAAMLRAPWLTTEFEQLNQQCSSLRQSLQAMRSLASRSSESGKWIGELALQFNQFAELYLDHEAAECNFLDSAYPGPEWVQ
jgi:hypothetical protein